MSHFQAKNICQSSWNLFRKFQIVCKNTLYRKINKIGTLNFYAKNYWIFLMRIYWCLTYYEFSRIVKQFFKRISFPFFLESSGVSPINSPAILQFFSTRTIHTIVFWWFKARKSVHKKCPVSTATFTVCSTKYDDVAYYLSKLLFYGPFRP